MAESRLFGGSWGGRHSNRRCRTCLDPIIQQCPGDGIDSNWIPADRKLVQAVLTSRAFTTGKLRCSCEKSVRHCVIPQDRSGFGFDKWQSSDGDDQLCGRFLLRQVYRFELIGPTCEAERHLVSRG